MKTKSRKTGRIFVFLLIVLAVLAYAFHFRWKWSVENYKKQLLAAGEKLTVDELIPPPVPPEQNSAAIFLKAADEIKSHPTLLDTNWPAAMHLVAPGKAIIRWMQPDIRSEDGTNSWEQIQAAVNENQEALALLQQITEHPALDFQLDYHQGPMLPLPHLAPARYSAQVLAAAAVCDLHRGDTTSAAKNVRAMLAVVKGTEKEPMVISQLYRIAIAYLTSPVTWEVLQSPDLTDGQLGVLQQDWTALEFTHAAEDTLMMERAATERMIANMRASDVFLRDLKNFGGDGSDWFERIQRKIKLTRWHFTWSYADELGALKGYQALINTSRLAETNHSFKTALQQQENDLAKLNLPRSKDINLPTGSGDFNERSVFSEGAMSSSKYLDKVMIVEVTRQLTITAIALKRYQLRNGNYPPTLKALAPQFLPAVPLDPVDGNPLRYQQSGKTFLLYSIGENGRDNGGDPTVEGSLASLNWLKGRDIAWPQPASPEEIAAYYQMLASPKHNAGATPAK